MTSLSDRAFDPDAVDVISGHFIDGSVESAAARTIEVRRPGDGRVQGTIPVADSDVVDTAVRGALAAQPDWAALAPRERAARLRNWAELLAANSEQLAREESLVSARLFNETIAVDAPGAADWVRYYAEFADKLDGTVTSSRPGTVSWVSHEPYGVVGAISPWNFPLILAIWKAAPAMAAGNAVVLKPSELTPYSITRVASLAVEAGIPPGVFNVVQGDGETTGRALVRHEGIGYVAFTGSTRTGAQIMADAALAGIKPVSLELGGKSPQLVFADCGDIGAVADHIAWGIARNAGQLCYAGTRLVVHESRQDELLAAVAARLAELVPGAPWDRRATLAPIASETQVRRIEDILHRSLAAGATLYCGGNSFRGEEGGWFFAPTILTDLDTGMAGYLEEFFGPILGVQTFREDDEGIRLAQHPVYGLAASVYSQNINRAVSAAQRLQAGCVWINTWGRQPDMSIPFGGYKQSGFGKEAGRAGIEKFLRSKAIWIDTTAP